MDKIDNLHLFCRIAELGSYSEVARERNVSRSSISRAVNELEKLFNVQLFKRTTRSLRLTDSGQELYKEAEGLLRQFEAMEDRISLNRGEAKGLLRVGVPGPLSQRFILPDISLFSKKYPSINVFFQVSESLSDLYKDELDMIIRMGPMRDSSLMAVKLSDLDMCLVASPEYLYTNPVNNPEELRNRNCICFRGRGRGTNWTLKKANTKTSIPVKGNFSADCGYTLREMALNGAGIISIPKPLVKKELNSGTLSFVLPDWQLDVPESPWSIHILYHHDRQQLSRVRAFIDFMKSPERLISTCNKLKKSTYES